MSTQPIPARREVIGYWPDIAFQYYVLARTGRLRCGYWYAPAGCAQMAVELLLKYLLVLPQPWQGGTWQHRGRVLAPDEIPHTHSLVRLWKLLHQAHPNHPLGTHQLFIEELDRLWREVTRYARHRVSGSASFNPTIEDAARSRGANPPSTHDAYALDIDALDGFVRAVFDYCNITPYLRGGTFMVGDCRELYADDNDFDIS